MEIIFREALPSDAMQVADVYLISRKTFLPFAPPAHSDDDVRKWMSDVVIPTGGVTVVVTKDTRILGMMAVLRGKEMDWIDQLYLHPSVVGQGIGSQLVQRAKSELRARIRLYTFQANVGACRFYERHGFRPIAFGDGSGNEERCPDVLYEFNGDKPAKT